MKNHTVKSHLAGLTASLLGNPAEGSSSPNFKQRVRGSGSIGAPTQLAQFSAGYQDLERKVEKMEAEKGSSIRVPIALCDDGDLHATPVDPVRVANLRPNLAANGQSSPAVCRPGADGRFEIVAGRHRKHALLANGETEWDIVVRQLDDDTVERLSFYDNLFAPNITDYAKFRGFEARRRRHSLTIDQLAKESGKAKGTVSGILSFGKLPEDALTIIESNQDSFGFHLVSKLAQLVPTHADQVTEVISMVAAGRVKQTDAPNKVLELARRGASADVGRAPTAARRRFTVSRDGREFATVDITPKSMTIKVANKAEAEAIHKAVLAALEASSKVAMP